MEKTRMSESSGTLVVRGGYTVIREEVRGGGCGSLAPCSRFVYAKVHRDKKSEASGSSSSSSSKTLFVANVDDQGGRKGEEGLIEALREQWGQVGVVLSVEVGGGDEKDTPPTSRYARIRFESSSSVRKATGLTWLPACQPEDGRALGGVKRYLQDHANLQKDASTLAKKSDAYMEEFDLRAEAELQERKRKAAEPDEDGFVTVTYAKRRGGHEPSQPEGRTTKRPRKKKETELTNFYRFQVREAKRDQLAKLREKFEADKEKVRRMKEARQFKPF